MRSDSSVETRAAVHAALGDPVRLAIVDELAVSDRVAGRAAPAPRHRVEPARPPPRRAGAGRADRAVALERRRSPPLRPPAARRARRSRRRADRSPSVRRCSSARPTRPARSSPPRCGASSPAQPADSAGTHPAERGRTPARSPPPGGPGSTSSGAEPRAPGRRSSRSRRWWSPSATGPTRSSTPTPVVAALVDPRPGARSAPSGRVRRRRVARAARRGSTAVLDRRPAMAS